MLMMLMPLAAALAIADVGARESADTFGVNTTNSSVVFRIKNRRVTFFYGRFNNLSGTYRIDSDEPSKSMFELKITVESLDTANAKRDAHLKGKDFFDAEAFPEILFKSTSVKKGKDADTYEVTGDMTLHGVTKSMTVELAHTGTQGAMSGFETKFSIKRSDFGMDNFLPGIADEVQLFVSVEGASKQ